MPWYMFAVINYANGVVCFMCLVPYKLKKPVDLLLIRTSDGHSSRSNELRPGTRRSSSASEHCVANKRFFASWFCPNRFATCDHIDNITANNRFRATHRNSAEQRSFSCSNSADTAATESSSPATNCDNNSKRDSSRGFPAHYSKRRYLC